MSSDAKKKDLVEVNVSFDDVSGGTETKKSDILILDPALEKKSEKKVSDTINKDELSLPIPTKEGGWTLKLMEEITGEEFLSWVKNVFPFSESMLPSAERLNKLAVRKEFFFNIVSFHKSALEANLRTRGIELRSLQH